MMHDEIALSNAEYAAAQHLSRLGTNLFAGFPGLERDLRKRWLNGLHCEDTGTVEYGPGHYYRVENFVVRQDSQGFETHYSFADIIAAIDYMSLVRAIYDVIEGDEA